MHYFNECLIKECLRTLTNKTDSSEDFAITCNILYAGDSRYVLWNSYKQMEGKKMMNLFPKENLIPAEQNMLFSFSIILLYAYFSKPMHFSLNNIKVGSK